MWRGFKDDSPPIPPYSTPLLVVRAWTLLWSYSPPKKTILSPILALVYVENVEMEGNSRDEIMELRERKVQKFQSVQLSLLITSI